MIVDDEPKNQRILAEILEGVVEFEVASSGEQALALAEKTPADLILLDIMMPGIDGYEVCRRLRARADSFLTKIVLVSGKAMLEERIKGYEAGADDYIAKPFDPNELLAKVKVFLKLTATEKELRILNSSLDEKVRERTSQLIEAEGRLVSAAKMSALGEMAGGIAHEINTPLCMFTIGLERLADLLVDDPFDKQAALEIVQSSERTVERIARIIRGLRAFSRDASEDPFHSECLRGIIDATLELCGERLKNANVSVSVDLATNGYQVRCRQGQISQILLNLIANSIDATEALPEKWIRISAKDLGDVIELSVTDSGNGLPGNVREKLFHPFFTTKEIGKGTGLGLSISKGIAEAHQGSLSIDTGCPNTRFLLRLPRSNEPAGIATLAVG